MVNPAVLWFRVFTSEKGSRTIQVGVAFFYQMGQNSSHYLGNGIKQVMEGVKGRVTGWVIGWLAVEAVLNRSEVQRGDLIGQQRYQGGVDFVEGVTFNVGFGLQVRLILN